MNDNDIVLAPGVSYKQVLFVLDFIRVLLITYPTNEAEKAARSRDIALVFKLGKQIVGDEEIKGILGKNPDDPQDEFHYQQLQALFEAVVSWLNKHIQAGNMPPDLSELVHQYEEDKPKSEDDKKKNRKPLTAHQRVVLAVNTLATLRKLDNPDFSDIVTTEKDFIAKYLETQGTTQYLDQFILDESITSAVPLAQALEPIIPKLTSTPTSQGGEYLRVTNLAKTLSSLELPAPLTNVLTALKLIHPTVQADQLVTTINSTPFTAKYGTVDSADSQLAGQLTAEHDLTATGQALTDQTIFADLRTAVAKGALTERQFHHATMGLSTLSGTLYGLSGHAGRDTQPQAQSLTILGSNAVEFVMQRLGIPTAQSFKQSSGFSWSRIHQALTQQHGNAIAYPLQERLGEQLPVSPGLKDFLTQLFAPGPHLQPELPAILNANRSTVEPVLAGKVSPVSQSQTSTPISIKHTVASVLSNLQRRISSFLSSLTTKNAPTTAGVAVGGLGAGLVFTLGSGLVAAGATGLLVFYGTRYYLTHGLTHTASVAAQTATTASHAIGGIVTAVGAGCASALVVVFMAVLSLPILLALLLFIINNSSLVVPADNQSNIASFGPITLGPGGEYPYCWPNTTSGVTVSGYWPNRTQDNNHKGIHAESIDLGTPMQTSIYSTHNGTVEFAGWNDQGYGNLVIIYSQDTGITSYYAHLSQVTTSKGNLIPAGTQVGFSGSTGNSDGPHLHYELQPESQIDIKFVAPFGDSCERYRPGNVVSIAGCEASISGGADKLSTSCHN